MATLSPLRTATRGLRPATLHPALMSSCSISSRGTYYPSGRGDAPNPAREEHANARKRFALPQIVRP